MSVFVLDACVSVEGFMTQYTIPNSHTNSPRAGFYFTGDGAKRDEDGYYWITGRVDDVINPSGHRIGADM